MHGHRVKTPPDHLSKIRQILYTKEVPKKTNMHKQIPHETGLALLMAAFFLSWAFAGLPALQAALQ